MATLKDSGLPRDKYGDFQQKNLQETSENNLKLFKVFPKLSAGIFCTKSAYDLMLGTE